MNLHWFKADPLRINVTNGGTGYSTNPAVTIAGNAGTYTSATAIVSPGTIAAIDVVGAMHYIFPPTVTLILWRPAPPWGRLALAVYPWAMAFALVYTAEHYFVDILLGWIYALVAFWTVNRLAKLLAERRLRRARGSRQGQACSTMH